MIKYDGMLNRWRNGDGCKVSVKGENKNSWPHLCEIKTKLEKKYEKNIFQFYMSKTAIEFWYLQLHHRKNQTSTDISPWFEQPISSCKNTVG